MVDRCLLPSYQLHVSGAYGHLQVDELRKTHISSYIWHASLIRRMGGGFIGWGYEISCVLCREGGVYECVLC